MRLKVEHVYPGDPVPTALVSETTKGSLNQLKAGQKLRCGGYSFVIQMVHGGRNAQQLGLSLESEFTVRPGMILRPANAPIADDEMASMLMRTAHILQMVCELDAGNTLSRLRADADGDLLVQYLRDQDTYDQTLRIFSEINAFKNSLPTIAVQRSVGSSAEKLNNRLSVMQLAGETIAPIGS